MPAALPSFGKGSTVQPLSLSRLSTIERLRESRVTATVSTLPSADATQLFAPGTIVDTVPGSRRATSSVSKNGQVISFASAFGSVAAPSVAATRFAAKSRCAGVIAPLRLR